MLFPNQLSLMLQCLNVDVAAGGESLSVPRVGKALETCSGCTGVKECRSWLRGDINQPLYRSFCENHRWLDTLPRLGPPQKVKMDKIQTTFGANAGQINSGQANSGQVNSGQVNSGQVNSEQAKSNKRPKAGISSLQRQFLEQLRMSGDIAMATDDKTTTLWQTVDECRKKGWVSLREISPGMSRLHLKKVPGSF